MVRVRSLATLLLAGMALGVVSCSPDNGNVADENGIESSQMMLLDSSHRRVMQECSQSMWGSWTAYDETNWPTGTTYGTYAYISNDLGAWGKLLDATYGCTYDINGNCATPWTRGWWTSCRSTTSTRNYTPCSDSLTYYGDLNTASLYDCQGTCTSGIHHHGGQCKPFMNLVAYRSGLYQNPGYAWKAFPTDTCITYTTATCTLPPAQRIVRPDNDVNMPKATYSNIVEGDYMRRPNGHALIIVRKISSSQVIVLDSNWTGGDGAEQISSHSMAFTSGDSNSNLGAYRVIKCAYTGAC